MSQQPDSPDKPEPQKMTHNVPPLAWVILALLVGVFLVVGVMRGGSNASRGDAGYMPPAPAEGDAPATPGGVVVPQPPR